LWYDSAERRGTKDEGRKTKGEERDHEEGKMPELQVGKAAPDFELPGEGGARSSYRIFGASG